MYKYTVTLKQETPLIHFQGDQEGAFLRASEVKPKFDKFLREHVEGDVERFRIGNTEALNYKMRISNMDVHKEKATKEKLPMYFNDIGENSNDTNVVLFSKTETTVVFLTSNKELIEIIEKWFKKFLLVTNFGFRQNKGYGSFTAINSFRDNNQEEKNDDSFTIEEIKEILLELNDKKDTVIFCKDVINEQEETEDKDKAEANNETKEKKVAKENSKKEIDKNLIAISKARNIYTKLKSGDTNNKSYIFEYIKKKSKENGKIIGNEKQYIKKFLLHEDVKNKNSNNNKKNYKNTQQEISEYKYLRGLLGISNGETYGKNEGDDYIYNSKEKRIVYESKNDIERYPSPVFFKVIQDYLFIIVNEIEEIKEKVYGSEFDFYIQPEEKLGGVKDEEIIKKSIFIPTKEEFNLREFIQSFMKEKCKGFEQIK